MPKITKETAPAFRAKANAARAAKKHAQAQAITLAESLLNSNPNAQCLPARLERQCQMLDRLILDELAKAESSPVKIQRWLTAQGMLLEQVRKVGQAVQPVPERRKRVMLEPVKRMAADDPQVTLAALQEVAKPGPVLAILPSPEPSQESLPQGEACPPPSPGLPDAEQDLAALLE